MVATPQVTSVAIELNVPANAGGTDVDLTLKALASKQAGVNPPSTDANNILDWSDHVSTADPNRPVWQIWDPRRNGYFDFMSMEPNGGVWVTGDIKLSMASVAPPGWLLCDGAIYDASTTEYVALAAVLGTSFNQVGDSAGFFRTPPFAGRSPSGPTPGQPLKNLLGQATRALSAVHNATHQHVLRQTPHAHAGVLPNHTHHFVHDHAHTYAQTVLRGPNGAGAGEDRDTNGHSDGRTTSVARVEGPTGGSSNRGISISPAEAHVACENSGLGAPFSMYHPCISVNFFIKL